MFRMEFTVFDIQHREPRGWCEHRGCYLAASNVLRINDLGRTTEKQYCRQHIEAMIHSTLGQMDIEAQNHAIAKRYPE